MRRGPLRKALALGVARVPHVSFAAASAIDWSAARFRGAPAPASRPEGVGNLPFADLELARRASWSSSARYRVLSSAFGTAGTSWPDLRSVSVPDVSRLSPPMVIATFHIGPMLALGALLQRLPAPTLAVTAGLPSRPGLRSVASESGQWDRVHAFAAALQALRADQFVFLSVDGAADRRVEVPLLGRRISIGAGAFVLSRISGAPILPAAARWRDGRIEIATGAPILAAAEETMASALARWLEQHVHELPEELGPGFVEFLYRSPLVEAPVQNGRTQPVVRNLAVDGPGDRPGGDHEHPPRRKPSGRDDLSGDLRGDLGS
jgi:hypothetical protein